MSAIVFVLAIAPLAARCTSGSPQSDSLRPTPISCSSAVPITGSDQEVHAVWAKKFSQAQKEKYELGTLLPITGQCVTQCVNVLTGNIFTAENLQFTTRATRSEINQIVDVMKASGMFSEVSIRRISPSDP